MLMERELMTVDKLESMTRDAKDFILWAQVKALYPWWHRLLVRLMPISVLEGFVHHGYLAAQKERGDAS